MTISMYSASIPVLKRMLNNLADLLRKGEEFAENKNFESEILVNSRLAPDMLPLSSQVQIACDIAKGCGARLAGVESPKFEDNEKTFAELYERINKTIDFLDTFSAEQIDGTETNDIVLELPSQTFEFKGMPFLLNFVLPNVYFHITTAYDILRHNGVEIGKRDYLGDII